MENKEEEVGTIIILHGWDYSTKKWEPFLRLLKNAGIKYKVLKIPGLTAPLDKAWTLDDYVSWLERITKNEELITILGHSNGGRIAAAFAAKFPEKAYQLVLINSAGIIRNDLKTLLKKVLFGTAAKIGKRITSKKSIRNLFYKVVGEKDYNKSDPILKETMINLISQDLEPIFSKINVPALIIWGKDDKVTPLSDGRKIHGLIGDSKFEVIEKARHSPQFTHPKAVVKIILKFLNHVAI